MKMKTFVRRYEAYFYVLPYLVSYVLFFIIPAIVCFYMSFTDWTILGDYKFIGTNNYKRMINDPLIMISLRNTFFYTISVVVIMYVVGLLLALLINSKLRGKLITRTIIFSSYVVMVTAVGVLWRWIFEPNYGILNYYLNKIGLDSVNWLTDPKVAMISIIITTVWWTAGFNMVVFLAGIQEIPEELYEAAVVDGANVWQKFLYITLPSLNKVSFFIIIMSIAKSFQMFGQSFVMTQGGPSNSTLTVVQYLYNVGFRWYEMGYASSIAYIIFAILIVFTTLQFKFYMSEEL